MEVAHFFVISVYMKHFLIDDTCSNVNFYLLSITFTLYNLVAVKCIKSIVCAVYVNVVAFNKCYLFFLRQGFFVEQP